MTKTTKTTNNAPLPFPLRYLLILTFLTALFTFYLKMPLSKSGGEDPVPAMGTYGPAAAYIIGALVALAFGCHWGLSWARYNEVRDLRWRVALGTFGFGVAVSTLVAGYYVVDGMIVTLGGMGISKAFAVAWPALLYLIPWLFAGILQLGSIPVDPEDLKPDD